MIGIHLCVHRVSHLILCRVSYTLPLFVSLPSSFLLFLLFPMGSRRPAISHQYSHCFFCPFCSDVTRSSLLPYHFSYFRERGIRYLIKHLVANDYRKYQIKSTITRNSSNYSVEIYTWGGKRFAYHGRSKNIYFRNIAIAYIVCTKVFASSKS